MINCESIISLDFSETLIFSVVNCHLCAMQLYTKLYSIIESDSNFVDPLIEDFHTCNYMLLLISLREIVDNII